MPSSGGVYTFPTVGDPNTVFLYSDTQYTFYEDASLPVGSVSFGLSNYNGNAFFTPSFDSPYEAISGDFNFQVLATLVGSSVPEPSGCVLIGIAAACLGLRHLPRRGARPARRLPESAPPRRRFHRRRPLVRMTRAWRDAIGRG